MKRRLRRWVELQYVGCEYDGKLLVSLYTHKVSCE